MRKFHFSLQSVLRLREFAEDGAKKRYLEAVARRVEQERERDKIRTRRLSALQNAPNELAARQFLIQFLERLDDDERAANTVLDILMQEEEAERLRWMEAKKDAEAMRKLRETKYQEWRAEAERLEQAALDEWAVLRRPVKA